ncbi:MAG: hypothetical protein QOF53_1018 [Nocardioidaceae bacterium]|nr:hypothetical protein [Nocardioidaceae bacterium]
MTLIEVLVTITVLTGGLLTTLGVFTQMGRASYVAQRQTVVTSLAQREMERLRVLPFASLALKSAPDSSAATEAPLTGTPAASEQLVVDPAGGAVAPGGEDFTVQGVSGKMWRYVTWRAQPCPLMTTRVSGQLAPALGQTVDSVSAALGDLCPGSQQTKRVTIVVKASDALQDGRAIRLSTVAEDPDSSVLAAVGFDGLKVDTRPLLSQATGASTGGAAATNVYTAVTAQTFHLTDTPCTNGSGDTRQAPGSGHTSHDTARPTPSCGSSSTAPDLMYPIPPTGLVTDPLPDLSKDVSRPSVGGLDLTRDDRAGTCSGELSYDPSVSGEVTRRKRSVHSWATIRSSANYETATTAGRATVTFWTQTATAQQLPGRLCATVWRSGTGEVLGSTDYSLPAWPTSPTQLAISFDLAHAIIPANERLMLTLRTPGDSGADILLLYDHPGYPTSLSITTVKGKELK